MKLKQGKDYFYYIGKEDIDWIEIGVGFGLLIMFLIILI